MDDPTNSSNQPNDADSHWQFSNVAAVRRVVEPEFFDARAYLRDSGFGTEGAEGYVLMMCRDYILPLLLARGRELLNEANREAVLGEKMRAFVKAELAELERRHWAPSRDEFGGRCFTDLEFQQRFESMIRRELESKILPELAELLAVAQAEPNGAVEQNPDEASAKDVRPAVSTAQNGGTDRRAALGSKGQRADTAPWRAIEILFLSDERVQIHSGTGTETRNYAELGFADRRGGKPNRAWLTFRAMAEEISASFGTGAKTNAKWPNVEKRIQEIRKVLRNHFSITADPIPFVKGTGYQACFKIGCSPSFHT